MLHYGCFNIDISGSLTQYLKKYPKFSRGRTLSFPQTRHFGVCSFNANEEERGGSRRRGGVSFLFNGPLMVAMVVASPLYSSWLQNTWAAKELPSIGLFLS